MRRSLAVAWAVATASCGGASAAPGPAKPASLVAGGTTEAPCPRYDEWHGEPCAGHVLCPRGMLANESGCVAEPRGDCAPVTSTCTRTPGAAIADVLRAIPYRDCGVACLGGTVALDYAAGGKVIAVHVRASGDAATMACIGSRFSKATVPASTAPAPTTVCWPLAD